MKKDDMPKDKEPENISRRNFMVRGAMGGAGLVLATEIFSPQPSDAAPKSTGANHDRRSV